MTNGQYLDAISAPKVEVTAAGKSAPLKRADLEVAGETKEAQVVEDDVSEEDDVEMSGGVAAGRRQPNIAK